MKLKAIEPKSPKGVGAGNKTPTPLFD